MAVKVVSRTRLSSSAPRGPSEANSSDMAVKPEMSAKRVAASSGRGCPGSGSPRCKISRTNVPGK
jgi:hypothetical protein